MSTATQGRAGTPGPDRWIRHEIIGAGKAIQNYAALYAGATVTNGVEHAALVLCAGASRGRLRFKATCAGSLEIRFVRPNNSQLIETYTAGNPTPVSVSANVETYIETTSISGEAQALVVFTPSAGGTVSICDWGAL